MGSPSDDDVPTMTSSADLRRRDEESDADAEDRTIQKPPDAVAAIEAAALNAAVAAAPPTVDDGEDRDSTVMSTAPKPSPDIPAPVSSTGPGVAIATAGAIAPKAASPSAPAAASAVPFDTVKDKLPPPPSNPLRPRLPSAPNVTGAVAVAPMRPRMPTLAGVAPAHSSAPKPPASVKLVAAPSALAPPKADAKAKLDDDIEGPPTLESEPPPSEPATSPKTPAMIGEPSDDSITATAPRVPASLIPLTPPKQVEIRTLEDSENDDSADQTEVKTLAKDVGEIVRAARDEVKEAKKANASANASVQAKAKAKETEADAADDSVTAQAPVVPVPPSQAAAAAKASQRTGSSPVIRISNKSLMPGGAAASPTYNPDEEDSVTERGLPGPDYRDDSVTTQSPGLGASGKLPAPIDGETEGTTKRVRAKDGDKHAADDEQDSVTAAAPGHLTNMLRVIASPTGSAPDGEEEEYDDDPLQAHTQVMLNAPVKPPHQSGRRGGAAAARQLEPTSESGLRVANGQDANGMHGDRASLGALGIPAGPHSGHGPHSGGMRAPIGSDPALMGPSPSDRISRSPFAPMPMPAAEADKRPPYALLVGIVAIISIAIPIMLFFILRDSGGEVAPRVISQPTPDPVGLTGPRPRAKPSATTAPTNRNGGGPIRGPIRR